jgi:hypothetical protein
VIHTPSAPVLQVSPEFCRFTAFTEYHTKALSAIVFTLPDNMYLLLCIRPRRQGMYLTISSSQSGTAEAPSDKVLTDAPAQA